MGEGRKWEGRKKKKRGYSWAIFSRLDDGPTGDLHPLKVFWGSGAAMSVGGLCLTAQAQCQNNTGVTMLSADECFPVALGKHLIHIKNRF